MDTAQIVSSGQKKKTLIYFISTAVLLRDGHLMLDKIVRSCAVFRENSERIELRWIIQDDCRDKLHEFAPDLTEEFDSAIFTLSETGSRIPCSVDIIDENCSTCDAFYGDMGYIAWRCAKLGKPVMIQDASV